MEKIYMIEESFCDCDWHYELKTEYGFFLTLESAREFMRVYDLPSMFADKNGEGFRVVEIKLNKEV
jgi:hypothetical protein